MSATVMEGESKQRTRLILNGKDQLFPEKLYDVANDGYLIKWNRNGSISPADEELFERTVMKCYPGFLQIPSFVNFRRLFREYGFEWCYNQDGTLEFSHPSFVRGRRQLLSDIRTRRKSFLSTPRKVDSSPDIIEADPGRRYPTRKRRKTVQFSPNESCHTDGNNNVDIGGGGDYLQHNCSGLDKQGAPAQPTIQNLPPRELDLRNSDIMKDFAKNEFNEEEYYDWIAKQRKLEECKVETTDDVINEEYSWMYYNEGGEDTQQPSSVQNEVGELVDTAIVPMTEEMSAPCGMCKCCMSMNNILNVETNFGILQNNINSTSDYVDSNTSDTINYNRAVRNPHSVYTSLTSILPGQFEYVMSHI